MSTRLRDFVDQFNCFFVTTTFNDWMPLFINDNYYLLVIDSLKFCLNKYKAEIIAYVLMPNHIHLVLFYTDKIDLSGFMRDFKKYTSSKIRQQLFKEGREKELEELRYIRYGQMFKIWKDRFDAVVIRNKNVLVTKMKYIHNNPVKKGLVEREKDWKYSSSSFYLTGKEGIIPITHAWKIIN